MYQEVPGCARCQGPPGSSCMCTRSSAAHVLVISYTITTLVGALARCKSGGGEAALAPAALPALTGRTRVFDQSSNTRVRPVIGQTLSDRSAHQLVGQACPTSAWLVLSDQSGTLLDRCLPIRASWSTGAQRSDQAGRPVCTGQISLIDRVPVEHWWVCSTGACSTGAGSTGGSTILTIIESDRIEWDDDLETNSSERLNRQRSNRAVRRTGLFDRCTHQCSTRTLVEHPVRPVNRSDNLGRLAHWSTRLTRSVNTGTGRAGCLTGRTGTARHWSDRPVRPAGERFGRTGSVRSPVEHGCSSSGRTPVFDRLMLAVQGFAAAERSAGTRAPPFERLIWISVLLLNCFPVLLVAGSCV
ncbi:hypothetical protein PCASD_09646 [Puccinia coronata f. sp. avenae]|uniref:Uncharacterized protein n=1 Tax=Puccinia coronata f. sp. avenae TaxID=200324 RepID=A0A2N5UHV6_9BASI|nr:hypothetical protein PCASD_09646 [Puccinia coronata f. sp. avenae]